MQSLKTKLFVLVGVIFIIAPTFFGQAAADDALVITACPANPSGACAESSGTSNNAWSGPLGSRVDVIQVGKGAATARIPVNPSAPLATPPGWTAPTGSSVNPSPPSTATLTTTYSNGTWAPGQIFTSGAALCAAISSSNPVTGLYNVSYNGSNLCVGPNGSATVAITTSCPTGYTLSAGVCGSPNALTVVKPPDTSCGVRRVANVYTNDSADPDCAASPVVGSGTSALSATGLGTSITVTSDASGTTIVSTAPNAAGTGSKVTTVKLSPPAADNTTTVTGIAQSEVVGVGTAQTTTPTQPGSDLCALHPGVAACDTFSAPATGTLAQKTGTWYDSKYPGGLNAIWDARKAALMASPLGAAIANMALPSGSGSVPSWTLNFNIAHFYNLGTYTLSIAPWIWAVVKTLVLLSAAFACRRIIFGG